MTLGTREFCGSMCGIYWGFPKVIPISLNPEESLSAASPDCIYGQKPSFQGIIYDNILHSTKMLASGRQIHF